MHKSHSSPLINSGQAARYLGISTDTLRRYHDRGLRYVRIPGARRATYYYRREWLDEWVAACTAGGFDACEGSAAGA